MRSETGTFRDNDCSLICSVDDGLSDIKSSKRLQPKEALVPIVSVRPAQSRNEATVINFHNTAGANNATMIV